ncbi:MAG: hypothetical protein MUO76_20765 [Anaerolineaceae bacterium]|nr:hypothetical protein [Anaerolineaceae bacterium]
MIYCIVMGEREPSKEFIDKGERFFLCQPGGDGIFSGYGLTVEPGRKDYLIGLLMVDRPRPVDPEWLKQVENVFGECQLVVMTPSGERGMVCQMQIEPESLGHLRRLPMEKATAIKSALAPLLEEPPTPIFTLHWNENMRLWQS